MTINLKVKSGNKGFVEFLTGMRRIGWEIVKMQPFNGYQIVTCVLGKGGDDNWMKTMVIKKA